jgi:hypothetical protein
MTAAIRKWWLTKFLLHKTSFTIIEFLIEFVPQVRRQKEIRDLMKKKREKAVLVDRISRSPFKQPCSCQRNSKKLARFSLLLIYLQKIVLVFIIFSMKHITDKG